MCPLTPSTHWALLGRIHCALRFDGRIHSKTTSKSSNPRFIAPGWNIGEAQLLLSAEVDVTTI